MPSLVDIASARCSTAGLPWSTKLNAVPYCSSRLETVPWNVLVCLPSLDGAIRPPIDRWVATRGSYGQTEDPKDVPSVMFSPLLWVRIADVVAEGNQISQKCQPSSRGAWVL